MSIAACYPSIEIPPKMDQQWSGARMREIREAAAISQGELGRRVGQAQAMISQWESGRRVPDVADLKKLCDALECWCDTFYCKVGTPIRKRRVKED